MNAKKLLEKYSRPGPRYTSYPTAPHFHEHFNRQSWQEELIAGAQNQRPLSLYAHIPFCDTLCYFCGCNMIATHRYERVERYLQALFGEMDRVAQLLGQTRTVEQLHWGGGTPTYLHPEDIDRVAKALRHRFADNGKYACDEQGNEIAEISCEIDPRELTFAHLQALRENGFNRVSFGVQDLDPQVQLSVNRIEPESMVREVFGWSKQLGFQSINLDLMTGLPHQSLKSFEQTLAVILDLKPDRLAVFAYAHLPQMIRHQRLIPEASLPDFDTRLELQLMVRTRLLAEGYINIGMDHYALPSDEMVRAQQQKTLWRNFQGYTTHKDCDILAFGVSAISQTETVYCQNHKKINDYQAHIAAYGLATQRGVRLSTDDQIRRDAISRLMCHLELDIPAFEKQWNINVRDYFAQAFTHWQTLQEDGLVHVSTDHIRVPAIGLPFIRNIVMGLDAYLAKAPESNRFSKTI